jgi:eukaryotic translation initiation factor 2C
VGFVVNKGIISLIAGDFCLFSHAGILVTSLPAYYIILKDDNFKFALEMVQELAWNLCHVYVKANRSMSIPAPVYYADIVCS